MFCVQQERIHQLLVQPVLRLVYLVKQVPILQLLRLQASLLAPTINVQLVHILLFKEQLIVEFVLHVQQEPLQELAVQIRLSVCHVQLENLERPHQQECVPIVL